MPAQDVVAVCPNAGQEDFPGGMSGQFDAVFGLCLKSLSMKPGFMRARCPLRGGNPWRSFAGREEVREFAPSGRA